MASRISAYGSAEVDVPYGEKISVYSERSKINIYSRSTTIDKTWKPLVIVAAGNYYTSDAFTSDQEVLIEAGSDDVDYAVGVSPDLSSITSNSAVTKLASVETGATGDQTGAEIKALYEAEADTNAFSNAYKTKLDGNLAAYDTTQTWTAPQNGTTSTANDGACDLSVSQFFSVTTAATTTLSFSNLGVTSGVIFLYNSGGYTITKGTNCLSDGDFTGLASSGTYVLSFISDGTSVYVGYSGAQV